jgi:hypothetical protein
MYPRSTRTTKRCPACGLTKPIDQFHRDRSRPDGATWTCAQCQNAQQARYRATHRTPTPAQLVPPDHKRCKTCQEVKPLDAFLPSKRSA